MKRSVRVAIIGCGRMGRLRAAASAKLGADVVLAFDASREAAQDLADSFPSCRAADRLEEIDSTELDAIFVCTPPSARGPVELEAARRGIALFVEKPIGLSALAVEPVRKMLLATRSLSAVGYMNRYRESVRLARGKLSGEAILGAHGHWINGMYRVPWWTNRDISGGSLNEQATHLVDLTRFLLGEVVSVQVSAVACPDDSRLIGTAAIVLRCEGDVPCALIYSCRASYKSIGFQVFTDTGNVTLTGWNLELQNGSGYASLDASTDRSQIFYAETEQFLTAVETGMPGPILCDFEDACRTQLVMDAIDGAISTHQTIPVNNTQELIADGARLA